jgi:26S proteasome regulatory subunit N10
MRNGDYSPNRILAVQEAANILISAKMQQNAENTVGFLTMGGKACNVVESLTADADRVQASLTKIPLVGDRAHFARALQIACLALSHRSKPHAEQRIVVFIGSEIREESSALEALAKKLRKDNVAVDIVALGVYETQNVLVEFNSKINKDNNSRLLIIPEGHSVIDMVVAHPIVLGNEAAAQMAASGGQGDAGFQFGFDPNMDPELAAVLRMSLEEERQRQLRESQAAASATTSTVPTDTVQADSAPPQSSPAQAENEEDDELALALKMSVLENAEVTGGGTTVAEDHPERAEGQASTAAPGPLDPDVQAAMEDEEFMKALQEDLDKDASK